MFRVINRSIVELIEGDITEQNTEAIVNAANNHLQHGGGVAGAIIRKGGMVIQSESNMIGFCPTGEAVITRGGNLKAKYVIHTVGPIWGEGREEEKLVSAIQNSLKLADNCQIKTLTFPAVSCGIYAFPVEEAARIILKTIISYLEGNTKILKVVICLYSKNNCLIFARELADQLPE